MTVDLKERKLTHYNVTDQGRVMAMSLVKSDSEKLQKKRAHGGRRG